jgi:hypothetical protein
VDNDIIATWQFHTNLTIEMLEAVQDKTLMATGEAGGRTIGVQFAHLHNVRCMWLEASAPDLMAGVEKIWLSGSGVVGRLPTP